MTEPVVKWAGGKRRSVGALLPLILERRAPGGRYVEPFLGGASVALAMPENVVVVASDVCQPLVATYLALREDPHRVHELLASLIGRHTESVYYAVRGIIPRCRFAAAARFIYLNKAGFNGLYRVNRAGHFNVPCGKRRGDKSRPPGCPTLGSFVEIAGRMSSWLLSSGDFEEPIARAREGDVIYADPPYDETFSYSSGFGPPEQRRLSTALRRAARRGVGVVTTNADTPFIRRLYRWAVVSAVDEARSVAADGRRRDDAACVVAVRP